MNVDDISNRSRTSVTILLVLVALLQAVKLRNYREAEKEVGGFRE